MMISAIVAIGPHGELGYQGQLPWPDLRADRCWFRERTLHRSVVMGRRTWESLPPRVQPLPYRHNIVLSRSWAEHFLRDPVGGSSYFGRPGYTLVGTPQAALDVAREECAWPDYAGHAEVVVIGGCRVYEAFWSWLDQLYVTVVGGSDQKFAADCFFSPWPLDASWELTERIEKEDKYPLTFSVYKKTRPATERFTTAAVRPAVCHFEGLQI